MTKTIDIKGDVIDNETALMYDYFGLPNASPGAVDAILNDDVDDPNDPDEVVVNIASNGGDVFAASEIYTTLRNYQGSVTVNVQGLAASAASVIAMAGDTVNVSPTAQIMIHKAWSGSQGNADDLSHQSEVLEGIDNSIANAYVAKTGKPKDEVLHLMSNETWLTAQDAVDQGFADEIMFVDNKQLQAVNATGNIISHEAVNKFLNLLKAADKTKEAKKPTKMTVKVDANDVIKDLTKTLDVVSAKQDRQEKLAILLGIK
ncbi:Clp protease ClpP [Secundilactobacillus kimchicus]|uniref:head maturation protease, ClpP-related n=1 Tax=Secundilactobacillus kimchicus TaxID=528209 RepID=UPI001C03629C|nr:head maturation protease, ClpP-related [Secundilactobacillus kimchicus]MBT9670690.1 Clp protease ClpP [Secundilactobacillus kimchicus]